MIKNFNLRYKSNSLKLSLHNKLYFLKKVNLIIAPLFLLMLVLIINTITSNLEKQVTISNQTQTLKDSINQTQSKIKSTQFKIDNISNDNTLRLSKELDQAQMKINLTNFIKDHNKAKLDILKLQQIKQNQKYYNVYQVTIQIINQDFKQNQKFYTKIALLDIKNRLNPTYIDIKNNTITLTFIKE